jgi:hypothetical protein
MKKVYILAIATLLASPIFAQSNGFTTSPSKDVVSASANGATVGTEKLRNGEKLHIYSFSNNIFVASEGFGMINGTVEVFDLLGKQVTRSNFYSNNFQMQVDVNAASIYLVRVTINGRIFSERVYIK